MFELFNIGLDMQKRMIDLHMRNVEAARDMVETAQRNVEGASSSSTGMDGAAKVVSGWLRSWGIRD